MSLIEIVIVMGLIAGIMGIIISQVTSGLKTAKEKETQLGFGQLKSTLQMYQMQNGHFPTTEQGLLALVQKPDNAKAWRGPYCEPELLNDAWGQPIQYESDGRMLRFLSGGNDEKVGTDDDIKWPAESEEPAH
jgi:general secretion pathway protein G